MLNENSTPATNGITITEAGTYKIDFGVRAASGEGTVALYNNGTIVPSTTINVTPDSDSGTSIIQTLTAGSELTLRAVSVTSSPISLDAGYVNAYLTVTPIHT